MAHHHHRGGALMLTAIDVQLRLTSTSTPRQGQSLALKFGQFVSSKFGIERSYGKRRQVGGSHSRLIMEDSSIGIHPSEYANGHDHNCERHQRGWSRVAPEPIARQQQRNREGNIEPGRTHCGGSFFIKQIADLKIRFDRLPVTEPRTASVCDTDCDRRRYCRGHHHSCKRNPRGPVHRPSLTWAASISSKLVNRGERDR